MGKTGRKNKVYSAEFKIGVIMDMREHHLSYHETVRKHWGIEESNNGDSSKSWNNKKNVVKMRPEGYTPGDGTGFIPGETFPGETIRR